MYMQASTQETPYHICIKMDFKQTIYKNDIKVALDTVFWNSGLSLLL
jgi:hypothetical protein